MTLKEPDGLFPLPLTAFEKYILSDESEDYPMTFFLQIRLRGTLVREFIEDAVDEALNRHPLLCCRIELIGTIPHWIWAPELRQPIEWNSDQWKQKRPWSRPRDLRKNIGIEGWAELQNDVTEITLQFHHACCDGIGASQFLEDIASAYSRHFAHEYPGQPAPQLRTLNPQLLRERNSEVGRRIANLSGSVLRRFGVITKYSLKYLRQRIVPLAAVYSESKSDASDLNTGLVSQVLSRATTRSLRNVAKHHSATLNDVLVRDLMLVTADWNADVGPPRSRDSICVLTPNSLRGPSDDAMPAANVVGYVFLTRNISGMKHSGDLLCSLRDEMQLVHKYQAGWFFLQAIRALQQYGPILRLYLRQSKKRCMSTAVLSHLGNALNSITSRLPSRDGKVLVGNVELESIRCIPPIRPHTHVVLATMLMNGQLIVNVRMNPHHFSIEQTHRFMTAFVKRLERTANETEGSP